MTGSGALRTARLPEHPWCSPRDHATSTTTTRPTVHGFVVTTTFSDDNEIVPSRRPRSGSEGLDCLAALAERERESIHNKARMEEQQHSPASPSKNGMHNDDSHGNTNNEPQDDDEEDHFTMPPPRPRRPRSVSNPEDMMTYDPTASRSSTAASSNYSRRCLVLPACILENELAEAAVAVQEFEASTAATCAATDAYYDEEDEVDSNTAEEDPDTLLQRARARLLEDLAEPHNSSSKHPRTELNLPHCLSKYKEVRVSLFDPAVFLFRFFQVTHKAPFGFLSIRLLLSLLLHFISPSFSVPFVFGCLALLLLMSCTYAGVPTYRSTIVTDASESTPSRSGPPYWRASTTSAQGATGKKRFATTAARAWRIRGGASRDALSRKQRRRKKKKKKRRHLCCAASTMTTTCRT